jgi:hypothetical protein
MNPTWGKHFLSNAPFQGSVPNQPTPIVYSTQNPPQPNFSGLSKYLHIAYGPTGIPTKQPPQNYQFP